MSGFADKLNIKNSVNSAANSAHCICTECPDFQRNWIYRIAYIQWEIVYIKMYGLYGFVDKLKIQNCVNSTRNCVH